MKDLSAENRAMQQQAVCTVKDVEPSTQAWLRDIFGNELPAEQRIRLTLVDETNATDAKRQAAWSTIHRILDRADANMQNAPDDYEAAVDEAMQNVRPRRS